MSAIKAVMYMVILAVGFMIFYLAFTNITAISSAADDFGDNVSITDTQKSGAAEKRLLDVSSHIRRQCEAFLKSLPGNK